MGRKHKSLEDYIKIIPEQLKVNLVLLEEFRGNRTNISFTFSCGCKVYQSLKPFLLRHDFDLCVKCKADQNKKIEKQKYICNYCGNEFLIELHCIECKKRCKNKYENLVFCEDYVVCNICGFHGKQLKKHVKQHDIKLEEYDGQLICSKSLVNHNLVNRLNSKLAVQHIQNLNQEDYEKRINKISTSIKNAILSNPNEIKRRSELMSKINETLRNDPEYIKSLSDRAKIVSARPEIKKARSERLNRWRENNPKDFYNKCTKKMIGSFQSKPEKILYNFLLSLEGFSFKRNQFVHSEFISNKSSKKQIDIADKRKRIYVEFDGILHFIPKFGDHVLNRVKQKDQEIDKHIIKHNWILIRVSYDQFKYSTKKINKVKCDNSYFIPECLDKVKQILIDKRPGVYRIGESYNVEY